MSRALLVSALLLQLVYAAIDLAGDQVVFTGNNDSVPIGNIDTYYPSQHDCPLPCTDVSITNSWTPYHSPGRLSRCSVPMLLQFSVFQPLEDTNSHILIRACSLTGLTPNGARSSAKTVVSWKRHDRNDVDQSSAYNARDVESVSDGELQVVTSLAQANHISAGSPEALIQGLKQFFNDETNFDERMIFAYHEHTVVGAYTGRMLNKTTVVSALDALDDDLRTRASTAESITAQLCNPSRPDHNLGISIRTTRNLAAIQQAVLGWNLGVCVRDESTPSVNRTLKIQVAEVTPRRTNDAVVSRFGMTHLLDKRAVCSYIQVQSGDSCASLAQRCGISANDFTKYNPDEDLCSTLMPDDYVCCSTGDPFVEPKPQAPEVNSNGTCATYFIKNGDTCDAIAKENGVTIEDIEGWNKGKTWAWTECKAILVGYNMCLSEGDAPLPPPQTGTECGPLVPGTTAVAGVSMADLNPCPLKACCSNWGFCGVFPDHCDVHAPEGGGPGSKLPGYANTCVSNCGVDIKTNSDAPAEFQRIGYYEAFGMDRECLRLQARNANTDGSYTHVHWAFATISPDWRPVINDTANQWSDFKDLTDMKRVISFGGWAYSTEAATYGIIRSAIIDNAESFASNIAQFVNDEGIDGVDIDWEYPGVRLSSTDQE
jgi:hypothetical protein